MAFTSHGRIHCRHTVYKITEEPLDAAGACKTCQGYSRALLHHLIKADEVLGAHLLAHPNVFFYLGLMRDIRSAVLAGDFIVFYALKAPQLALNEEFNPPPRVAAPAPAAHVYRLGNYEIVLARAGGWNTVRQIGSGEVMRSSSICAKRPTVSTSRSRASPNALRPAMVCVALLRAG